MVSRKSARNAKLLWDAAQRLVDETSSVLEAHAAGRDFWIDMIEVPSGKRSTGLGARIVRAVEDAAKADGFERVRIWAADTGAGRSNRWWESLGYTYDYDVDEDDERAWYMSKRLTPPRP